MRCPHCGAEAPGASAPCPSCGRAPAEPGVPPPPGTARVGEGALQFSHSGRRYLLGYGVDFFGIWDRERTGGPVERFRRTDDGWRDAWTRYIEMEPDRAPVAVGLGAPPPPDPRRRVSKFLWLLPVLFGWLGGLAAWAIARDRQPRTARNMLLTGIAVSAAGFIWGMLVVLNAGPR